MRTRVIQTVLTLNQRHVCLFCRLRGLGPRREQRYQSASLPGQSQVGSTPANAYGSSEKSINSLPGSSKGIAHISSSSPNTPGNHGLNPGVGLQDIPNFKKNKSKPSVKPNSEDDAQERQKVLQQKFVAKRRQQMLETSDKKKAKVVGEAEVTTGFAVGSGPAKSTLKKSRRSRPRPSSRKRRRAILAAERKEEAARTQKNAEKSGAKSASQENESGSTESAKKIDNSTRKAAKDQNQTESTTGNKGSASQIKLPEPQRKATGELIPPEVKSEKERKVELANQLHREIKAKATTGRKSTMIRRTRSKAPVIDGNAGAKSSKNSTGLEQGSVEISQLEGYTSLRHAIGRKASHMQGDIETIDATKLEMLPLKVDQPPVPALAYGLERVLFNPGVYYLQDPRSRVYNFDPYLQKIMPVAEFDFNALKEYITSSKDESLKKIAKQHQKRYVGSTSSMTSMLSHFHFLLSQWRPIDTSMMSKSFPARLESFTELLRTPSAIFLRWKDGSYAIDADKQFDNANILSMLGKSMEKLLTLSIDDYEKYRKSSPGEVSEEEQFAPESYHYSAMGDFLMRSQLDAHDPRLPGTGMFDLKTRAVVSIRMDVTNYEYGVGYEIKSRQGEWESFEREYYDLIRAAFLKYSMQVRMGRMDGIFVAFHNIERIFGFQYISLPEMDSTIHGQWDTSLGDQEFKLSLDLLNKILDKATKRFPEKTLRIHFETRDAATPFMYIFAEPVTEEQVVEIQSQNRAKIEDFERKILGLKHEDDSDALDEQEDDGKWENIHASVQETMDMDELSMDDRRHIQESQDRDVEEFPADHGPTQEDSDPVYQDRDDVAVDQETLAGSPASIVNEIVEHGDAQHRNESRDGAKAGKEGAVSDEGSDEENGKRFEDSPVMKDSDDQRMGLGDSENLNSTNIQQPDSYQRPDDGDSFSPGEEAAKETINKISDPKKREHTDKAAYSPPVPGEEPQESEYESEADRPFLDSMDHESAKAGSTVSPSSDILAMTLMIRNKVNDHFIHRPVNLSAEDKWTVEYSLLEVPTQQKAKALYDACQARRKKKLEDAVVQDDAEVVNSYLEHLRNLSKKGRNWRERVDAEDSEKPVQVLGREIATQDSKV